MRGFIGGMAVGALALLAIDAFAPLVGFGVNIRTWPAIEAGQPETQLVDRTRKGDRLPSRNVVAPPAAAPANASAACELPFSPLTRSAQGGDFARRCIAENSPRVAG
jgi:hypothetical protein